MASASRHIPPEEWSAHESTIRHLYYIEKLPVQSKKKERCLVRVLEDEYGFSATPEQYEMKFQEWRSAKNLKRPEWQQLLSQYDYLTAKGIKARITVSGAVVDEPKLRRQRRRYAPYPQPGTVVPEACNIPANRQAFVETHGDDGSWSRYTGTEVTVQPVSPVHSVNFQRNITVMSTANRTHGFGSSGALGGFPAQGPLEALSPLADLPVNNARSPAIRPSTYIDVLQLITQMSPGALGEEWVSHWHNSEYQGAINFDDSLSSGSRLFGSTVGPKSPRWGQDCNAMMELGAHGAFLGVQDPIRCSHTLVNSIFQHFKQMQQGNVALVEHAGPPNAEDVLERFESVLPDSLLMASATSGSSLGEPNLLLDSGLQALVYSIVNGFAGLQSIPMKAVFATIREEPKIQPQLFDILKSSPPSIAKTLADNLFRAAVESCDAEAMTIIISVANSSPQAAIDPNEMRISYEGRDYTPIELAAKFRNLEMVQGLLAAKADPNKTYARDDEYAECGALELAVRKWGRYESMDLKLVKLLLQCGATFRISLVKSVIHWGNEAKELLEEVLDRALSSRHEELFDGEHILTITREFENSVAARIISRFIQYCETSGCAKCATRHSKSIQNAFEWAAYRGNFEFVQCLSRFARASSSSLAGAVRSQNSHLIDFLLGQGIKVDEPVSIIRFDDSPFPKQLPVVTTPMAEAIKAQDQSRMNDIEKMGGYLCMAKEHHFRAAMSAAAEIGDIKVVEKLLQFAPAGFEEELTHPLIVAIHHHNTPIAILFLDVGAVLSTANPTGRIEGRWTSPFLEAVKQRDRQVLDAMIQEIETENGQLLRKNWIDDLAIRYAVEWGDVAIIERLYLVGLRADTRALTAAICSNQISMLQRILELGVDLENNFVESPGERIRSPLEPAVEKGDCDSVSLLLSKGVRIDDKRAWEYAMDNDPLIFNLLVSFFKTTNAPISKGFGGLLVMRAIYTRNSLAINCLIEARVDTHHVIYRGRNEDTYPNSLEQDYELNAIGFAVQHDKGTCYDLVLRLLDNGGNPNSIVLYSDWENGPMLHASILLVAIEVRSLGMVKLLIERGAEMRRPARHEHKRTPLQKACEVSSFEIAQFLLNEGVDPNEPPNPGEGRTALQLAATNGSVRIAQLLLRHHADPHGPAARVRGKTAFECAAENGRLHMLQLLWDAASPDGFPREEMLSARDLAREKGHRGCVDCIDSLLQGKPVDLLL
ncbi:hypothetical protein PG991_010388 [Apiospora marii]|uniref:Clr5 domain-containing protein n=1 Tax=Apiospora marii TaxID=335849 RepID=A0ABR1RIR5_9PEZI